MSTWTCNLHRAGRVLRPVLCGVLVLPLLGCLDPASPTGGADQLPAQKPGFLNALSPPAATRPPLHHAALAGGAVVVVGPDGYCIDRKSLRRRAKGGFALLASCETLSNGAEGRAVDPAILTVTVLPQGDATSAPSSQDLAQSLADYGVLSSAQGKGLAIVHLAQGGDQLSPSGDPRHWRAAMMINGHLVGLAAYAPQGSRIAGSAGQKLVLALAERMRAQSLQANPAAVPPAAKAASDQPAPGPDAAPTGLKKLFPKLFQ